jgi:decaprenylphospho-beta-D-erythro-pentofuranosid-2-ulose 2-reductase
MRTIAVLGATSGIAQACLREWVQAEGDAGLALRLVARDADRLSRVADDLAARGHATVSTTVQDLSDAAAVADAVQAVFEGGPVDVVLIAFGTMPAQPDADADVAVAAGLLNVNGTLALLAAHLVALRLVEQGSGALAVLGSVAGDRGRQSNYLYGAAKAMVATGVAGLQHRVAGTNVTITLVKPGPTATPMTDHLRGGRLSLAKVETVAGDIVRAVESGRPVVYTPRKWRLIMSVIRLLPRRVFERTSL